MQRFSGTYVPIPIIKRVVFHFTFFKTRLISKIIAKKCELWQESLIVTDFIYDEILPKREE